jgi:Domain of unknown function (DUF4411)
VRDALQRYCLDANVLINAWNQYYAKDICPDYWKELERLGHSERIFLADEVKKEIERQDDSLADWLKQSGMPVYETDGPVTAVVNKIFLADARHEQLVDNKKGRSLADPFVIAHAITQSACVVTKESMVTQSDKRIRIPNVCVKMGVKCINDFEMIRQLGLRFSCQINAN